MKRSRPTTLEPISAAMFLIVSLHFALAWRPLVVLARIFGAPQGDAGSPG
jgi:hypothetical protein